MAAALEYQVNEMRPYIPQIEFVNRTSFERLAPAIEVAIFRIAQEALTNVRLHSGATRAQVELVQHDEHVRLAIRDWGCGFDPATVQEERFGLQGVRQRASLLGRLGDHRKRSRPRHRRHRRLPADSRKTDVIQRPASFRALLGTATMMSPRKPTEKVVWLWVTFFILAGVVCAIYVPALRSPFIFDDPFCIANNPSIFQIWPLVGDSAHPGPLNPPRDLPTSGRPLVNLSLALNYYFGRLNPTGYHVFNLIVHLLSALMLMAIIRRALCLDYFGGRFQSASTPLALAAALLWAVHPLQTETVIYITQRTELMVGLFYLATLYGSLRYWAAATTAGRTRWAALSILACLAGMACKEVMVTAPLMVLLFERTFIAGSFRRAIRNSWPLYIGLASSWGLLLALNFNAPRSGTAGFHLQVPADAWWLTQTKVLWMYLKLVVWPWPLAIHYEMPYFTTAAAAWPWLLPTALLVIITLVLLWRRNPIGYLSTWVLVILLPTLAVPIVSEVAAERRMYLSLAALAALAVVGGFALVRLAAARLAGARSFEPTSLWRLSPIAAVALLLTLVLGVVSARRLAAYHDAMTLWQDTVLHQPNDSTAHNNLAVALNRAGHYQEAIEHSWQALRLSHKNADAHFNLAIALGKTNHVEEAIQEFQLALSLRPDRAAEVESALASILITAGRLDEAIEHCQKSLRLNPNSAEAHKNLGIAQLAKGQPSLAIEQFREALRLEPGNPEILNTLANALLAAGRPQQAVQYYREALQSNLDSAEAHYNLANLLVGAGELEEATDHYRQALLLKSDYGEAEGNLGSALVQLGRVPEAIGHLERAVRLQSNSSDAHSNLGIALFGAGETQEAVAQFQEALKLNPKNVAAHFNLGIALSQANRFQEAADQFEQSLQLAPDNLSIYASLIAAYGQLKQLDKAIDVVQKGLERARTTGKTAAARQFEDWLGNLRAQQSDTPGAPH